MPCDSPFSVGIDGLAVSECQQRRMFSAESQSTDAASIASAMLQVSFSFLVSGCDNSTRASPCFQVRVVALLHKSISGVPLSSIPDQPVSWRGSLRSQDTSSVVDHFTFTSEGTRVSSSLTALVRDVDLFDGSVAIVMLQAPSSQFPHVSDVLMDDSLLVLHATANLSKHLNAREVTPSVLPVTARNAYLSAHHLQQAIKPQGTSMVACLSAAACGVSTPCECITVNFQYS